MINNVVMLGGQVQAPVNLPVYDPANGYQPTAPDSDPVITVYRGITDVTADWEILLAVNVPAGIPGLYSLGWTVPNGYTPGEIIVISGVVSVNGVGYGGDIASIQIGPILASCDPWASMTADQRAMYLRGLPDTATGLPQVNVPSGECVDALTVIAGSTLAVFNVADDGATVTGVLGIVQPGVPVFDPSAGKWSVNIGADTWVSDSSRLYGTVYWNKGTGAQYKLVIPVARLMGAASAYMESSIDPAAALLAYDSNGGVAKQSTLSSRAAATQLPPPQVGTLALGPPITITVTSGYQAPAVGIWLTDSAGTLAQVLTLTGTGPYTVTLSTPLVAGAVTWPASGGSLTKADVTSAVEDAVPPTGFFANANLGSGSGPHAFEVGPFNNGASPPQYLPGIAVQCYLDSGHTQQAPGTGTVLTNNQGYALFNFATAGTYYYVATLANWGAQSGSIAVS